MKKMTLPRWRKGLPGEMWHEDLMCSVISFSIKFEGRRGRAIGILQMPDCNCCDMNACITFFQNIYPVEEIRTQSGDRPDTTFRKENGVWEAYLYRAPK